MSDPFVMALDALFGAPGSAAAIYQATDGLPTPIRVIRTSPESREGSTIQQGDGVEVRYSDAAAPQHGDFISIGGMIDGGMIAGGEVFTLFGEAQSDVERLSWTCGIEPYP